ncbi:hypothetical protein E2562_018548 [Oryza meyeriana var. granulata]|uniref:Uncharacterized protein n=1 Tax=Oryza meyeriana var. granulata TaxID=110450 RepID=A0A6G1F9G3_9ORYZ|nr:hypothetical protein E2562_018548 [Oryza meyeriana var. granulata]
MNVITFIEQCVDLKTLTMEDLVGRYKSYDEQVRFSYGDMNEGEHLLLTYTQWEALAKEKKGGECATKNHDRGGGCGKAGECRKPRKETALLAMADDEPCLL